MIGAADQRAARDVPESQLLRDVSIFTGDWLAAVDCNTRADINGDGVVNFKDFTVLAEEWRLKSWLYGL